MRPRKRVGHTAPSEPRRLKDSLDAVTRGLGGPSASALATLFGAWPAVVGEAVAAHSRPLSITDGVLTIAVDDPGWATQLSYLQTQLVARVEAAVGPGQVGSVRVRVRPR